MQKYILFTFIFILLFNALLIPQWSTDPNNTLIVGYGLNPEICSDSAGGCYITYEYGTTSYPRKLAVERLDKYGYKPWGVLKQIHGELPEQWQAEIIEDGEGGAIISYEDDEWIPPYDFTNRVRVQKVDSNGNLLWGQTGIRVTIEETNHGLCGLVSDSDGGCVIVWQDYDGRISMNRINRFGERVWSDSGVVLAPTGTYAAIVRASDGNYYIHLNNNIYRINQTGQILNQYYSGMILGQPVPDPEGGIVMSGKVWTGMIPKLVAQRKDSLGNNLWQEPYVEIADSLDINTQLKIQYNDGYYYYGWTGKKNGIDQVSQFQALRKYDGSKLFPQGSIQVSENTPIASPIIVPSEESKTIFIWNDPAIQSSTISQVYDTLGNKLWNENGVVVTYPAIAYKTTTDDQGGFITIGPINQFTIVAQQVNKYGQLGEVIIPVELIIFNAEVVEKTVKLNWVTATETNNRGFYVERFAESLNRIWERIAFVKGNGTTTEPKSYSFIDNKITARKYKYRLKQIDYDGTFKYSNEIVVEINYSPKEYILYQNYPNPFNSTTIIKYQIPEEGRIQINLYNILGEKIKTLFEGESNKGKYTLVVSSDGLTSGAYFYSLESNSSRTVKKLTILK